MVKGKWWTCNHSDLFTSDNAKKSHVSAFELNSPSIQQAPSTTLVMIFWVVKWGMATAGEVWTREIWIFKDSQKNFISQDLYPSLLASRATASVLLCSPTHLTLFETLPSCRRYAGTTSQIFDPTTSKNIQAIGSLIRKEDKIGWSEHSDAAVCLGLPVLVVASNRESSISTRNYIIRTTNCYYNCCRETIMVQCLSDHDQERIKLLVNISEHLTWRSGFNLMYSRTPLRRGHAPNHVPMHKSCGYFTFVWCPKRNLKVYRSQGN